MCGSPESESDLLYGGHPHISLLFCERHWKNLNTYVIQEEIYHIYHRTIRGRQLPFFDLLPLTYWNKSWLWDFYLTKRKFHQERRKMSCN